MKFTCSVEINAPIEVVSRVFSEPENAKHWHNDLISVTPVDGTPGEAGSTAILKFKKFDLHETIISNNLPNEFTGEYLAKGICWNTMTNVFTEIDEKNTRYEAEIEYRFDGLMVKIMSKIMPGMFRKQVLKSMERMKAFAETQV